MTTDLQILDKAGRPIAVGDRVAFGVRVGQKWADIGLGTVTDLIETQHGPNVAIKPENPKHGSKLAKPPMMICVVA